MLSRQPWKTCARWVVSSRPHWGGEAFPPSTSEVSWNCSLSKADHRMFAGISVHQPHVFWPGMKAGGGLEQRWRLATEGVPRCVCGCCLHLLPPPRHQQLRWKQVTPMLLSLPLGNFISSQPIACATEELSTCECCYARPGRGNRETGFLAAPCPHLRLSELLCVFVQPAGRVQQSKAVIAQVERLSPDTQGVVQLRAALSSGQG